LQPVLVAFFQHRDYSKYVRTQLQMPQSYR
jgi:hypothetical protein